MLLRSHPSILSMESVTSMLSTASVIYSNRKAEKSLINHTWSISRHITPLYIINALGDGHTDTYTHTDMWTKAISRNQVHTWFKNSKCTPYNRNFVATYVRTYLLYCMYHVTDNIFIAICSQGCHNGGTCRGPDICSCSSGWTGSNCTTRNYLIFISCLCMYNLEL